MSPTGPSGECLYSRTEVLCEPYLLGHEPRGLQLAFARLFDDCAKEVYLAGADLDEVIVERFLMVPDGSGVEREIAASYLSDPVRLRIDVLKALSMEGASRAPLCITAIKLVAFRDRLAQ